MLIRSAIEQMKDRLVELSEFKRRQSAPVLRISGKAFGVGRRIPIARAF